ncbi:zinc finger matrin-type protein CG9776 isoform X2 [Eurosta solidaginis]|uniref:zinc finger matrin-type protein CG9776 isoform X2 n=1 Tax=Eurosta solidaginis TaxID=178769 RepID=UPI003530D7BD
MEDDLILQQPADRRLGAGNSLPPGPPGAENDSVDYDTKKSKSEKDSKSRSSRRHSPSGSPARARRKSPSRGRRSPSPLDIGSRRRRRSPTPPSRVNRYRDYSPTDRRRYESSGSGGRNRRSPDRRRSGGGSSGDRSGGRGYRYRGRSTSRSRSRSVSPRRKSGHRWSPPKKKPSSPPINAPPPPQVSQPPPQAPPYNAVPQQIFPADSFAPPPTAYNQFTVPPPQPAANFQQPPPQADAYAMQTPAPPVFNAAYPPPPVWGTTSNDNYATQQPWIPAPDSNQIQQLTQQPPPAVVPPTNIPPPQLVVAQQQPQQPPPQAQPAIEVPQPVVIESKAKHDAVAKEAENQRDELKRQRSSYLKKTSLLRKELKMLKEQRKDLHKSTGAPPSPTTKGFIDENEKLQNQIQKKLSTIENVIDMLTGIIGEENLDRDEERYDESDKGVKEDSSRKHSHKEQQPQSLPQQKTRSESGDRSRKKKRKKSTSSSASSSGSSSSSSSTSSSSSSTENEEGDDDDDSSPERLKNKAIASMKSKAKDALKREALAVAKLKEDKLFEEKKRFNYVFYDPEMHWCQTCDVFPKTAKDYLNHLHSKEHMDRETIETPWHIDMITDQFPTYENAPTKRTPIRGLTFFIPASAWFCKLCSIWMGDLHCASTHLKSQLHASKYNAFLEKNPHYEVNWLADRQRVLNERKTLPLPQQITSVSTTAADSVAGKKSKKDEKAKKRKKKSSEKKDKRKKSKRSKKHKKNATSTSNSSESSSASDSEKSKIPKVKSTLDIQNLDNPNPAVSIRVAMRKQDLTKADDEPPPPAPSIRIESVPHPVPAPIIVGHSGSAMIHSTAGVGANNISSSVANSGGRLGKWTEAKDSSAKAAATSHHISGGEVDSKHDDVILQQWNTVQPVISESEKKLFEQLKGKLKNKPRDEGTTPAGATIRNSDDSTDRRTRDRERDRDRDRNDRDRNDRDRVERNNDRDRRRRSRSPYFGGRGGGRGGGSGRGRLRRTRSRSRGRGGSPLGRRRRTRSRSRGRRSRSFDRDRRRRYSRSRSRTRSGSRSRVEKPVVRQPAEFRPRVPENNKDREKRSTTESKDKKNTDKKTKTATANLVAAVASGKKLPFIGKMPVFKKQASGQTEAPTAAQIQMAMMEDAYGNAPPFHPDAGMMMDYDELMPDPMHFVNLMGQAPPPPPPPAVVDDDSPPKKTVVTNQEDDNEEILPPGIDEAEKDDCVARPIAGPLPRKGPLPKDLEEALNIIFPGEKRPDDDRPKAKSTGETQIIVEKPVMQPEDLAKQGIHMVTIEETSLAGIDEASQMSMNEPLVFNKQSVNSLKPKVAEHTSRIAPDVGLTVTKQPPPPPPPQTTTTTICTTTLQSTETTAKSSIIDDAKPLEINGADTNSNTANFGDKETTQTAIADTTINSNKEESAPTDNTPTPAPTAAVKPSEDNVNIECNLDDIPQPPPSPTDSEKNRRQEELNDLAMLGIDADDMAAQCI